MDSPTFSEDEEQEHSMESMDGRKDEEPREEEKKEEKEEVDEMPENHFKMVAFHAAIKAVLERQVEKLQLEVNESKRLVDVGEKESEEFAKELHEEQRGLVLEEDVVRNSSKKLERKQNKRERREFENRNYRSEAEKLEEEIEVKSLQNSSLRSKVNDLTGENLHLKVSRLDVENELGVEQACTDKGERDFKRAQEAKLFQDKYVGKTGIGPSVIPDILIFFVIRSIIRGGRGAGEPVCSIPSPGGLHGQRDCRHHGERQEGRGGTALRQVSSE